jgi:hypothetical protein
MYYAWVLLLIVLLVNLLNTIILSASGTENGLAFLYSVFNLFVGAVVGTYALYMGYYGVGKPHSWSLLKYKVLAVILVFGCITMALISSSCINGLSQLGTAEGYAVFATVVESCMYLAVSGLNGFSLYQISKGQHVDSFYANLPV